MGKSKEQSELWSHYEKKFSETGYEIVMSVSGSRLIEIPTGKVIGSFWTYFEARVYELMMSRGGKECQHGDGQ